VLALAEWFFDVWEQCRLYSINNSRFIRRHPSDPDQREAVTRTTISSGRRDGRREGEGRSRICSAALPNDVDDAASDTDIQDDPLNAVSFPNRNK
jgi:hypothetical protein